MVTFWIRVNFAGRWHRYRVEELPEENGRERWKVIAGNGFIILSNNRPILIKKELKHRQHNPNWKIEGEKQLRLTSAADAILKAVQERLK